MRGTMLHFGALAAIVAAGVVAPSGGAAQTQAGAAERLEARASHPNTLARHWVAAAAALEQAAKLRAADDPRALDDLIGAAGAYRVAGKLTQARHAALDAARRSVRAGDAIRGAHAYLAAASLSAELHDEDAARTYLDRADRLAASPRLTAEQKGRILAQLGQARGRTPE